MSLRPCCHQPGRKFCWTGSIGSSVPGCWECHQVFGPHMLGRCHHCLLSLFVHALYHPRCSCFAAIYVLCHSLYHSCCFCSVKSCPYAPFPVAANMPTTSTMWLTCPPILMYTITVTFCCQYQLICNVPAGQYQYFSSVPTDQKQALST